MSYLQKVTKTILLLILISLPVIGWNQRWNIYDSWRLKGYTPPPKIAELASQTTMNDPTRRLFYVYHPELDDKTAFNLHCRSAEQTIVLGCYVSGEGIYLYNVIDDRINGVVQVTAAHEVLHAGYERLSSNEKQRINNLLNAAFNKITDERIKKTISDYQSKGADINNELHSILGTEVRELPPELEKYYSRYFINRLAVVEYSEKYEQEFTARKNKIDATDQKLEQMKQQIENTQASLDSSQQALSAEKSRLDGLLAAKNFEAYNAGVAGYNQQVNAYNRQANSLRNLIDQYNSLVAERNTLAEEQGELVKAIDSRPETIETE